MFRDFADRAVMWFASILILAVGAFWMLRLTATSAIADVRAETQLMPRPHVVGGLRIPFDAGLSDPVGDGITGRHLLLVGSDECAFTSEVLDHWIDLIRSVPFRGSDGVTIVSIGDRTAEILLKAALARGVKTRVFTVTDPMVWALRSGISGTPTTVALDENHRVRLNASRDFLRGRGREVFRAFFAGEL